MVLWFPDWPVQAIRLDRDDPPNLEKPLAIATNYRIKVCGVAARKRGVRRGMKVRQAQAVCPELEVIDQDLDRDGRMFEGIVSSLGEVASSVEVLRPGLVAIDAAAAARYHGGEEIAAQMLIDAAARRGIDVEVGVADELTTAIIAARAPRGAVVGQGRGASTSFLAGQPLSVLVAEESLGCDHAVVNTLVDLGISTLGELAVLPVESMSTRFGKAGVHCFDIASARFGRKVAPALEGAQWEVTHVPEDPIRRVDAAAFVARALAARLHQQLSEAGVVCQLLKVEADFSDGTQVARVWRTGEPLTEAATADRVRWQLDGWLSTHGSVDEGTEEAGIITLTLRPLECVPPEMASGGLWDTGRSHKHVARQVIQRVQSTLGIDAVLQPIPTGGRGVEERIRFVAFGEAPDPVRFPHGTWPGRIPGPLPARLTAGINHPASRVVLIDATGTRIQVTAEALLSSVPYALSWGPKRYVITAWAGPWPVDDRWWESTGKRYARLQVVGQAVSAVSGDGQGQVSAWLLIWMEEKWRVEASY
ncbi:DNA polymerase Y family protein [Corynebacterium callunae]|uniref:Y-family DNA polymerase n=1 Tax=Corynebacterium callunae TaxID=1721 RepID=UPI003982A371